MYSRRLWLVALMAIFGFVVRRRGIVLDYKNNSQGRLEKRFSWGKCYMDGVEIAKCWYIDKEAGLVRTYDMGNGQEYTLTADQKGLQSRTIRGTVRLITSEGEELMC